MMTSTIGHCAACQAPLGTDRRRFCSSACASRFGGKRSAAVRGHGDVCREGHALAGANLLLRLTTGERVCATCNRARALRWQRARRAARQEAVARATAALRRTRRCLDCRVELAWDWPKVRCAGCALRPVEEER